MHSITTTEIWQDELLRSSVWWPYEETGEAVFFEAYRPQKKYGVAAFLSMLVKLLPRGRLWEFPYSADASAPGSVFGALLGAFAAELDRFDTAVVNAMTEAVPGLSVDMLSEWETELGLPEPEMVDEWDNMTDAQKRAGAQAKYTTRIESLSEQFFTDLAAELGIAITISTGGGAGTPFRTGGPSTPSITRVGSRVYTVQQLYVWIVHYPASTSAGIRIIMEGFFNRLKPAHTYVQFVPVFGT